MKFDGILQFDDHGRLYMNHECDMCFKYPIEDMSEPCLKCGHTQLELITLENKVNRVNKAIDLMAKFIGEDDDVEVDVREAFLHLSGIKLGEGMDEMIFTDVDMTQEIRGLADVVESMCRVIIYPTDIHVHENPEEYEDEEDDAWSET